MFDLQQMYAQGMSIRAIARASGHDRKTIRRWVKSRELPKYKPRPRRPSKLNPYIISWLEWLRECSMP